MSNRLDQEREKELEPKRMKYAIQELNKLNVTITCIDKKRVDFIWNGNTINLYPYSGWHTGRGIKDGRGIHKLLKQLKDD